jgi:CheY-like chemotaxis protein
VCAVLRHFGAEALAADSTRDALERIASFRPDVLLADIAMPSEDGYALIERIRQFEDPAVNSVAAAALTAFTATEDRLRVLSAGYQLHVGKPVDPVELALSVAHLAKRIGSARRSAMNYTQPNTAGEPQAG